jgi:hypothetical protein
MIDNHWSSLESMQEFVNFILVPYLANKVDRSNLLSSQQMQCVNDCWNVHTTNVEFRAWMKEEHPPILLLYVLADYTSKF